MAKRRKKTIKSWQEHGAKCAAHALNHKPRRSLCGNNACRTYFEGDQLTYSRRKRRQAWDWIRDMPARISEKCKESQIAPAAW